MKYAIFEVDTDKSSAESVNNFLNNLQNNDTHEEARTVPSRYTFLICLSKKTSFLSHLVQSAETSKSVYRVRYFQDDPVTFEYFPAANPSTANPLDS